MTTARLQDLLAQHLQQRNLAARTFAERSGIPYPTLLGVLNKGTVPRKAEHRDILRRELNLDTETWATTIALSQRDGIEIPAEGPLTLQQLVLKTLLSRGHTEQSFAQASGLPYPTLMGITRRGSVPRGDTIERLSAALDLPIADLQAAAERSRDHRRGEDDTQADGNASDTAAPSLAQLAAEAVALSGGSIAAWARQHHIPYLSLIRLLAQGEAPQRPDVLDPLRTALGASSESFSASLSRSRINPEPAHIAKHNEQPATPLQAALQAAVQERNLTLKAFAETVDLSPLTASKLLKGGELPGRVATHLKLRTFLGLADDDYQGLLARSRQLVAEPADLGAPSLPATPLPIAADEAAASTPELSDDELFAAIRALDRHQRRAVVELVIGFR